MAYSETEFEKDLIKHLACIGGTKQWSYVPKIKTTNDLWNNFKKILEQNNPKLNEPLSKNEFKQIKKEISSLKTPYEAGQFIYGLNGISQVEVDLDNGDHVFLTVFDQDQVGAGNTRYQIVNQIERPAVLAGRHDRRFDTTLLINGLPIIQIEEKKQAHEAREALNQMHQYIDEKQYTDIFSTLQILVGMTPTNIRYMANTTSENFNIDFAFQWQNEKNNNKVRDWREFSNLMLSIPMAHQMATSYMILDGTRNRQSIKIMRPYQVYATRNIINKLKNHDFSLNDNKGGYIWHTTGSGKTISSFKAAWLASRLPNVDTVVFMVDRVALTSQTADNYQAYDPNSDNNNKNGIVFDTSNINILQKKLNKENGIIVTSIQKMDRLVQRSSFKSPDKNIVFIVDEAHRSTAGDMMKRIKDTFTKSIFFGYTGTPSFDGITTEELFGVPLHIYTIREAIADHNVLGFKVDFNTTLSLDTLKEKYLPEFYKKKHPKWSSSDIKSKINNLTPNDMDDAIESSVYDSNPQHIKLVVKDILDKWRNRSDDYRYSALFTVHIGGGASTPRAIEYYNEFKNQNSKLVKPLKIAITFSEKSDNSDSQLKNNQSLRSAIEDYNKTFNEHFDDTTIREYTENVISRLNRTINDNNYLNLVIVVDQLLTGFDAPYLNTLYVDRTLSGANLIQAYSRTNRIQNMQHKPFGRIVNYRWPAHTKSLMNEALSTYADTNSANLQTNLESTAGDSNSVVYPPFDELINTTKNVINKISNLTDEFSDIPSSEFKQNQLYKELNSYNRLINQLKQDDAYDYDHPEKLLNILKISKKQEDVLTGSIAIELKEKIAKNRNISFNDLTLNMTHVNDVKVNYDYLDELIVQLANQIHDGQKDKARETYIEINKSVNQLDDYKQIKRFKNTTNGLYNEKLKAENYPVKNQDIQDLIKKHINRSKRAEIGAFRKKWGLLDIEQNLINSMLDKHVKGNNDLDIDDSLSSILFEGTQSYKDYADDPTIRNLKKMQYRNKLRKAIEEFSDYLVENY